MGKREVNKRQSVAEMGSEPRSSDSGTAPAGPPCPRDLPAAVRPLWKAVSGCVDSRTYPEITSLSLGPGSPGMSFFSWASLRTASVPLCKTTVGEQHTGLHAQSEFKPSDGTAGTVASRKSTLNQPLELTSN